MWHKNWEEQTWLWTFFFPGPFVAPSAAKLFVWTPSPLDSLSSTNRYDVWALTLLLICCYGILPAHKVMIGQFCNESQHQRSKALLWNSAASAICFSWCLTGTGKNGWEGNTMSCFYLFFLTSWHFVPPFFHLLLEKMQRLKKKPTSKQKRKSNHPPETEVTHRSC